MGKAPDKERTAAGNGSIPRRLIDPSPAQTITMRNSIKALHWRCYKRVMEDVELALANDRQWMILRKRIMDLASDTERDYEALVNRVLAEPVKE